jgi:hypothetical protein
MKSRPAERSRALTAVALLVLATAALAAQTTGDIQGRVTETSGAPLPGATIEASSPKLQGIRVAVSERDGAYRVLAVPPGEYRIRASLSGFETAEESVTVSLDATATLDVKLKMVVREAVTVSGEAPLLDIASTTSGTNYTNKVIAKLPVARNYADIVRANPGVNTDNAQGQGRSLKLTVYGATSAENQWIIDGVNTTNIIKGFQGKAINNEFVDEVEVKTGGYQAEYGRALGGVVNVITKAGGNAFRGDVFLYGQSAGMRAEQVVTSEDSELGVRYAPTRRLDYGADLNGFLVRDKLWFFAAYNRVDTPGTTSNLFSSAAVPRTMLFPRDQTDSLFAGKLTWNIASSSTLVATAFSDPSRVSGNASGIAVVGPGVSRNAIVNTDPSTWETNNEIGALDAGLRFNQLFGSSGLLTAQVSTHQDRFLQFPTTVSSGLRTEDWTCAGGTPDAPCSFPIRPNSVTGGLGSVGGRDTNTSRRDQYRLDGSLFAGEHELKIGADVQKSRTRLDSSITGGQLVQQFNQFGFPYYVHTAFVKSPTDLTSVDYISEGHSTEMGLYLQDSWKPLPGLTVNAGLRWDQQDLRSPSGGRLFKTAAVWQPRLGIVWSPGGNGTSRVFAFVGRFSYPLPTSLSIFSYGVTTFLSTFNFDPVDKAPDEQLNGGVSYSLVGGSAEPVDVGLKGAYQDELTLGFEKRIDPTFSVGIKATYRRLGQFIEDRCDLDPTAAENGGFTCAIVNPGSDGKYARGDFVSCNGLDAPFGACGQTGAPPAPPLHRIYRGLDVLVRKSIRDTLWLQASYTYSSLRGNTDGGINQNFPLLYPGANVDRDYPQFSHKDYGRLFLDRPHSFRLDASYAAPFGLFVGVQGYVQSGAPLSKMGYFNFPYNFFYGGSQIYLTPRGTEGRLPALWESSLTVGYPIRVGEATVTIQAYVFNLFNNQIATWASSNYTTSPPPGYPASLYNPAVPPADVSPDYGKVLSRQDPRLFRMAIRVSF